jgi:hypothetical protein
MTTSPFIIAFAIVTLFGIVIMVLDFVIPDTELSKGIIVGKHTDAEYKINHVYIIGDIPICSDETIPTKYYLDIRGYNQNNKMQTITIDVSEETYNQYAVSDTWDSSTHKE